MKTWQEMAYEEMRRLVAASDGLLNLSKAGAPAGAVMQARDKVCGAVADLNTILKAAEAPAVPAVPAAADQVPAVKKGKKSK